MSYDIIYDKNIIRKQLNFDSSFRTNPNEGPTDFLYTLPAPIEDIVSIRLSSIEFPNTFFAFSKVRHNTTLGVSFPNFPTVVTPDKPYLEVVIPDGNYNTVIDDNISIMYIVQDCLHHAVHPFIGEGKPFGKFVDPDFKVTLNTITGYITIACSIPCSLHFPKVFADGRQTDYGLGYNLGFTQEYYESPCSRYTGEIIVDVIGAPYIFLQLDGANPIQHFSPNKRVIDAFAKILLYSDKNAYTFDNGSNFLTKAYKFLKPSTITFIRPRLIDSYGHILDLNGKNYSFTLELEIADKSQLCKVDYNKYVHVKKIFNFDSSIIAPTSIADYEYELPESLNSIISVRLSSIELPNTFFNFTARNGNIKYGIYFPSQPTIITPGKDYLEVSILEGNYNTAACDNSSIMNIVENCTNMAIHPFIKDEVVDPNFITYLDNITGHITFKADIPFILYFNNDIYADRAMYWGLGYNLGFSNRTYLQPQTEFTAEGLVDVIGIPYVFLQLNNINNISHLTTSTVPISAFAKIPLIGDKNAIIFDDGSSYLTKEHIFHQPINFATINPRLIDVFGNLLDLNGKQYSFTLEFDLIVGYDCVPPVTECKEDGCSGFSDNRIYTQLIEYQKKIDEQIQISRSTFCAINNVAHIASNGFGHLYNAVTTTGCNIIGEQQRQGYLAGVQAHENSNKYLGAIMGLQHALNGHSGQACQSPQTACQSPPMACQSPQMACQSPQMACQSPSARLNMKLSEQRRLLEKTPWSY